MYLTVSKSGPLNGTVTMPRSKLHSFRALFLASLADGTSYIRKPKLSSDWHVAVESLKQYGATIEEVKKDVYKVDGVGGKLKTPGDIINVNNSGTMLFFACGIAAACKGYSIITGDESLRTLRKISKNFIKPFQELGVEVISTKNDGMAPFIFKGAVNGGSCSMDGIGCQPVFSVLIAAALSKKPVDITVKRPGETAYIDLLLYWFDKVGLKYTNDRYKHYHFPGNKAPQPFDVEIPYEWSTPGYALLAAMISPNSEITVKGMDMDDPYGDKQVLDILIKMGANLTVKNGTLTARTSELHGVEIDMNSLPDQLPTVAIAACYAKGKTIIKNTETARWKECDRITAVCTELKKMGAKVEEKKDGLIIDQDGTWQLKGAKLHGYYDHRMVLAFAVAALQTKGKTTISDAEMMDKSFGNFYPEMTKAGARMEIT